MKNKRVVFCDLDGTLIQTLNGSPFPKGIWDMKLKMEVWKALKLHFDQITQDGSIGFLFIVSNQGGIERGLLNMSAFEAKISYVKEAIQGFVGRKVLVDYSFTPSNNPADFLRKPNPGMLDNLVKKWRVYHSDMPKEHYLMIGDASGKPGQFSDSDYLCAKNFGIDYMDVDDYVLALNRK